MSKDQDLKVIVENGVLSISVGINVLPTIIEIPSEVQVVDQETFALEVMERLTHEAEDGTTLIHELFDVAADRAIEDGCNGIDFD